MSRLPPSSVAALLGLLEVPPDLRTSTDLQQIVQHLASLPPIHDLPSPSLKTGCCKQITLFPSKRNQSVFLYGEDANRCYVILKGSAIVKIPTNKLHRKETRLPEAFRSAALGLIEKFRGGESPERSPVRVQKKRTQTFSEIQSESDMTKLAVLEAGDMFGELALSGPGLRNTTVECAEDCLFLVIESRVYQTLLMEYEEKRVKAHVKLIREIPAFSKWTRKSLAQLVGMMKERECKKGEVLYREGEVANAAYIIIEGEFKFCKQIGVDQRLLKDLIGERLPEPKKTHRAVTPSKGPDVAVLTKSQKQIFGHQEILDDCPRRFTCICLSRFATVLQLSKPDFLRKTQSQDTWNVLQNMGRAEKDWVDSQLSKLGFAELEKRRIAMMKIRPKTPGGDGRTSEMRHRRVVSMVDPKHESVNASFEVNVSRSFANAENDASHMSSKMYRSFVKDGEKAGSGLQGKSTQRKRTTGRGSESPGIHQIDLKSESPDYPKVPHFQNFNFQDVGTKGRVSAK